MSQSYASAGIKPDSLFVDFSGSVVWDAATTSPAIGNGTITAKYIRIGNLVIYMGRIVAGSTTTFGTGEYEINFPLAPTQNTNDNLGTIWLRDNTNLDWIAVAFYNDGNTAFQARGMEEGAGTIWTATTPATWAVDDQFAWHLAYETQV